MKLSNRQTYLLPIVQRISFAVFAAGLMACSVGTSKQESFSEMTVCKIVEGGSDSIGMRVRSSGTYQSDMFHYSFIIDKDCGSHANLIDLGKAWGVSDYDRLRRAWRRDCDRKGSPQICIVNAEIIFTGTIRQSSEGDYLVVDLDSVGLK